MKTPQQAGGLFAEFEKAASAAPAAPGTAPEQAKESKNAKLSFNELAKRPTFAAYAETVNTAAGDDSIKDVLEKLYKGEDELEEDDIKLLSEVRKGYVEKLDEIEVVKDMLTLEIVDMVVEGDEAMKNIKSLLGTEELTKVLKNQIELVVFKEEKSLEDLAEALTTLKAELEDQVSMDANIMEELEASGITVEEYHDIMKKKGGKGKLEQKIFDTLSEQENLLVLEQQRNTARANVPLTAPTAPQKGKTWWGGEKVPEEADIKSYNQTSAVYSTKLSAATNLENAYNTKYAEIKTKAVELSKKLAASFKFAKESFTEKGKYTEEVGTFLSSLVKDSSELKKAMRDQMVNGPKKPNQKEEVDYEQSFATPDDIRKYETNLQREAWENYKKVAGYDKMKDEATKEIVRNTFVDEYNDPTSEVRKTLDKTRVSPKGLFGALSGVFESTLRSSLNAKDLK